MTRYDLDRFKIILVFYTASLPFGNDGVKNYGTLSKDVILSCVTNRELKKAKLSSKTPIKQLKNINIRITALSRHVCFAFKTGGLERDHTMLLTSSCSTVHTNTMCMRFHFASLSTAFSKRCVFNENAQRFRAFKCGRKTKTHRNVSVFKRKRISVV